MITDLQLDDKAPWKQRFRAPVVAWTQIAPASRAPLARTGDGLPAHRAATNYGFCPVSSSYFLKSASASAVLPRFL